MLSPWDHWTQDGRPREGTQEIEDVLESVLAADTEHPGANQDYIHVMWAHRRPSAWSRYCRFGSSPSRRAGALGGAMIGSDFMKIAECPADFQEDPQEYLGD